MKAGDASHELIDALHALADRSGDAILPYFRGVHTVEDKADGHAREMDPVTEADRAGEAAIVAYLSQAFPQDRIVGEEFGTQGGAGPRTWVIDPIDGTRAFIIGAPTWGTLVGVQDGDRALAGIMDQPFTRERFWGDGATSHARLPNGDTRQISARASRTSLADAFLSTTSPDLFAAGLEAEAFERLRGRVRTVRFGLDCYAYCLVANGTLDLVVEAGLRPYDIAGLVAIIEGAGGVVTTWDGGSALQGGRIIAAANRALHAAALEVLNQSSTDAPGS